MAAIDDLNTAVTNLTSAVQSAVSQIESELQTIENSGNEDPAVEQAVTNINTVTQGLNDAVTAAQAALAPK